MAFQGEGSKKNVLRKGLDRLGRINYFSQNRESTPMTQAEAQPLRGAVAELAAIIEVMDAEEYRLEQEQQERERAQLERNIQRLESHTNAVSDEAAQLAGMRFRLPADAQMDINSFRVVYEGDRRPVQSEMRGKLFLGSGEEKIELDVVHEVSSEWDTGLWLSSSNNFFYEGIKVENTRGLHEAIFGGSR
jgi:hypothetical protein